MLSLISALLLAAPQTIRRGELWPDDRGKHIQAHGGGIIKVGNTYFWFGEDRGMGDIWKPKTQWDSRYFCGCRSRSVMAGYGFRRRRNGLLISLLVKRGPDALPGPIPELAIRGLFHPLKSRYGYQNNPDNIDQCHPKL
jgi:hypothetical protein